MRGMIFDELQSVLLARAERMGQDPSYVMHSGLDAWVRVINLKRFRPYFDVTSKKCLTLAEARNLKARFLERYGR